MAEALINVRSRGAFLARSAGSAPSHRIDPSAIGTLLRHGVNPGRPFTKSWNEFVSERFDFVIAVGEELADEPWPLFPGRPRQIIWPVPHPLRLAAEVGRERAFDEVFAMIEDHVGRLVEDEAFAMTGGG